MTETTTKGASDKEEIPKIKILSSYDYNIIELGYIDFMETHDLSLEDVDIKVTSTYDHTQAKILITMFIFVK